MHRRTILPSLLCLLITLITTSCGTPGAPPATPPPRPGQQTSPDVVHISATPAITITAGGGIVTAGTAAASTLAAATTGCTSGRGTNFVAARHGVITATDGSKWTVPAPVTVGAVAADLYNDCTGPGDTPNPAATLQTVVLDPDGVEVTGDLFADNYFELYINGQFVARDPIGFTPFNANVVRFKDKYPMTYAFKLVDWETHLGVGMEYDEYKVGDGGFIAAFSDGTVTNAQTRCQVFYIAPLDNPTCVTPTDARDTSTCPARPTCADTDPLNCQAIHFQVPTTWADPDFDDSTWPTATIWPPAQVTNQPAYTNHASRFASANFIWTHNLNLDNLVLCRLTVSAPPP